jgi:hypothetical protein
MSFVTMRSPHNAASDVITELGMERIVRDTVEQDPQDPHRWLVTFESMPGALIHSRLHVEIMEGNPHPYGCVLERHNVGYRAMNRIMDKLLTRLQRGSRSSLPWGQPPSGGSPPPSPPQDRRGPPEGDMPRNVRPRRHM